LDLCVNTLIFRPFYGAVFFILGSEHSWCQVELARLQVVRIGNNCSYCELGTTFGSLLVAFYANVFGSLQHIQFWLERLQEGNC